MGITPLSTNLNNVQALSDQPNATDGLTPGQVKAAFDAAGNSIKTYINSTMIPEIDAVDATLVTKTDLTTTRKLSADGNFTGSWFGFTSPVASDPGIQNQVNALEVDNTQRAINVCSAPYNADPTGAVDSSAAFIAAIANGGRVFVPSGTYKITQRIDFSGVTDNSFIFEGCGESSVLMFVGASAGLYDKYTGGGEEFHTKVIRDLYLYGDGSAGQIGFNYQGLQGSFDNLVFDNFETGIYVYNGGYLSKFKNVYCRYCKFSLTIDSAVTTLSFEQLHIRFNNDAAGACVYFKGANVEGVKIQGVIEGNKSPAIWYASTFSGDVVIEDLYPELCGDNANSIKTIKNESTNAQIRYVNSRFPRNVSTWTSGDYDLGTHVILDNCRLTGRFSAAGTLGLSINNSLIDDHGGSFSSVPLNFSGLNRIGATLGASGAGVILQLTADDVSPTTYDSITNLNADPFSASGANVAGVVGTSPPTIAQETTEKFAGNNSTKITWTDSVAGSSAINCCELRKDAAGTTSLNAGALTIVSFLIKGNKAGNIGLYLGSGVVQVLTGTIAIDTKWRRYILIGRNNTAGAVGIQHKMFCRDSVTGFISYIEGITVYKNIVLADSTQLINKLLQAKFQY